MAGEEVFLTCTVATVEPDVMIIKSNDSDITVRTFNNILLENDIWKKGINISLGLVEVSDTGNYTCEAKWNDLRYTREDTYTLNVTGG